MFVIYHKDTTRYLCNHRGISTDRVHFESLRSAQSILTREFKKNQDLPFKKEDFLIIDSIDFYQNIEKKKTVKNLMTGKDVEIPMNTPLCCDVSSNTYWSM